jgi:hypothetical protein
MKIFVDENIPLDSIAALTKMGHNVLDNVQSIWRPEEIESIN